MFALLWDKLLFKKANSEKNTTKIYLGSLNTMGPKYFWTRIFHFMYSQKFIKFEEISKFDLKLLTLIILL